MENVFLYLFAAGYYIVALGPPVTLVIAQLIVAWPVLRGSRTVNPGRRRAALLIALVSMLSVASMLPVILSGKALGLILLAALTIPSALTLLRLHQTNHPALPPDRAGL